MPLDESRLPASFSGMKWHLGATILATIGMATVAASPLRAGGALDGIAADIDDVAAKHPGIHVSIAVENLSTGEAYERDATRVVPLVGAMRLHLLLELHRQVAVGKIDPTRVIPSNTVAQAGGPGILRHLTHAAMSLQDYAALMVLLNDNVATNVLIAQLGLDGGAASAKAMGLQQTRFEALPASEPSEGERLRRTSSARDMLLTLKSLARGEAVDPAATENILKLLALPKPMLLRSHFSREVTMAGLTFSGQMVRSECAIVSEGDERFVICILLQRSRAGGEWDGLFGQIAAKIARRLPVGAAADR